MSHENRPSIFGVFGNKNDKFKNSPVPVPDTRRFVDYERERAKKFPKIYSFTGEDGYAAIEPTVLSFDLSILRTDVLIELAGNLVWYQSSTNLTDIIKLKYERQSATAIPFQPGNKLGGVGYTKLYMSNAVIAGATGILILLQDSADHPVTVL